MRVTFEALPWTAESETEEQGKSKRRAAQEQQKQAKSSTECTHVFGVCPWTLWSRTTSKSTKYVLCGVFPDFESREECWLKDVRVRVGRAEERKRKGRARKELRMKQECR